VVLAVAVAVVVAAVPVAVAVAGDGSEYTCWRRWRVADVTRQKNVIGHSDALAVLISVRVKTKHPKRRSFNNFKSQTTTIQKQPKG
jgi:hypothetical protein